MNHLSLELCKLVCRNALEAARQEQLSPLSIAIIDASGELKCLEREDNASPMRTRLAIAKARSALMMGMSSRALGELALERPDFFQALNALGPCHFVPAAGGILIRDQHHVVIGAIGISGDTSDKDEACAVAGLSSAGLLG